MLRKFFTVAAAIVAVGGAFVGSSNAKNLLQDDRRTIVGQSGLHSTASASAACPGSLQDTCAYVGNSENPTEAKFRL
ncbi:hypothetical protein [Olivibacter jilunii]|uniref:hypothetical protein n=1 Tax=Olivibacter jilunii TaxID=985016 RepID=UPI0010311BA5|nr:hypothetical protein [Olivibacter jilunii]